MITMTSSNKHISVLLESSIEALNIKPDGVYIDATLGRGGHSELILNKLGPNGRLIGIDQDNEAIEFCKAKFQNDQRMTVVKNNFGNLEEVLTNLKIDFVDGVLMDLGVSSPQFDNSYRGFSYKLDGPLDMRMDQEQSYSAYDLVNKGSFNELCKTFRTYGDVKNPVPVVNNILKYRAIQPISTTLELVDIIKSSLPAKELYKSKHPAKVYFQALRIAVNNEIEVLENAIDAAAKSLSVNGRLAIITFHSLEDKIVVRKFKELSRNKLPKEVPLKEIWQDYSIVNTKAILPTTNELQENNRAHSSKLRTLQRIKIN